MATPTSLFLNASVYGVNSVPHIRVQDLTVYPHVGEDGNSWAEANLARLLFISDDQFVTVLEFDQSNLDSWIYEPPEIKTYNFCVFAIGRYEAYSAFDASTNGCIVWYDGACYKQVLDVPTGNPIVDTSSWKRVDVGYDVGDGTLDVLGVYNEFTLSVITGSQAVARGFVSASMSIFPNYQIAAGITKTDCHTWRITNNAGGSFTQATIYDYAGEELSSLTINDDDSIDIELDNDGAFIVNVTIDVSGSGKLEYLYFPIFDFCDAQNCFTALFKYIKCKCTNPCDADCIEREKIEQRRNDLVLIRGLLDDIKSKVFIEKTIFINNFAYDDERQNYVEDVGRSIALLAEVVNRCGACTDETNEVEC